MHTENMKTRLMKKKIHQNLYEVDIDFDLASEAWRANKISIGNGEFVYKVVQKHVSSESPPTNNRYNLRSRADKN
jgi:hypothetical protein